MKVPMEEWAVCIPNHHPGYVSWDQYLATQQRLRANSRSIGRGGGAAREGSASLLQGLVRCGKCGRKMMVHYSGRNGSRIVTLLEDLSDARNAASVPVDRWAAA